MTYRVAGLLTEVKNLISARSLLREKALDGLHRGGVEIVSPSFMNTRAVGQDRPFIPEPVRTAAPAAQPTAEDVAFDKAEEAAGDPETGPGEDRTMTTPATGVPTVSMSDTLDQLLALQGVDCLVVDKSDFVAGASSKSSRMIHGGLRYLENREFGLVRESLAERNRLLANAADAEGAEHPLERLMDVARLRVLARAAGVSSSAAIEVAFLLAWETVAGSPADGVDYAPQTSLRGVVQKPVGLAQSTAVQLVSLWLGR